MSNCVLSQKISLRLRTDGQLFENTGEKYVLLYDDGRNGYWGLTDNGYIFWYGSTMYNHDWPLITLGQLEEEYPDIFANYERHKFLWSE